MLHNPVPHPLVEPVVNEGQKILAARVFNPPPQIAGIPTNFTTALLSQFRACSLSPFDVFFLTPTKLKTVSRVLYIESPQATDVIPICYVPDAATVIAIRSVTDAGTVTFNIEQRGKFTPATTGTNCLSADQVADTTGEEVTSSFNDATVPADNWLVYVASAMSGAGKVWVSVEYTVD